jgi:hypothetical protein
MDTIEFFSAAPGLADIFPIIPAKQYRADWMNAARADWVENKDKFSKTKQTHIFQCPGIFDLFNHGYIIPMWHDLLIKTDGTGRSFSWSIPSGALNAYRGKEIVGSHKPNLDKFIPKRPWSIDQFVKLDTPWNVVAPKGVKFLMLPITYPDEFIFENATGILDPSISTEINLQLYWNNLKGDTLIKAGTPIGHLIPLTEKTYELVVRDMNDNDRSWLEKKNLFMSMFFRENRSLLKTIYNKHFGKK